MALLSFLDRERSVAHPGYSRWLVPPAALAIHLAIGQVYAFSVFKIPLTQLIGITKPAPDDWKQTQIAWIFSLAIVMLGLSAAAFGKWLEGAGPRKAMFASAVCFALGFFISYVGVVSHQLWLLYLGYGIVGGTGLGLGYISPVSTLIKWFPDRPGLATGMAIMGFGGGAMIGSPLSIKLMTYFRSASDTGVGKTFLVMGTIYFIFMMFGVFTIRVPRDGWKPEGWTAPAKANAMITTHDVDVNTAFGTPQFWMLWVVLCTNVTAGIGIIEQASPMIQELFKGSDRAGGSGRIRWSAEFVQHGGKIFLVDRVGLYRTKVDVLCVFCIRSHAVLLFVADRRESFELDRAVCGYLGDSSEHVWWRVRDGSGVPARHVRNVSRERDPWTTADGVVYCGRARAGAGELYAGISARAWSGQGERVSDGAACDGGAAGDWVCSELDGEARGGAVLGVGEESGAGGGWRRALGAAKRPALVGFRRSRLDVAEMGRSTVAHLQKAEKEDHSG